MPDYWIKLYHEIIDDPKMATLPDRLWRRTVELFLLAGKLCPDKSGTLPDTKQLAWLLRIPVDDLQTDLEQLESTRMIEHVPDGWLIVNFQKRQGAASDAERKKQQRERDRKNKYYGHEDVTDMSRNVTQINRAETEQSREQIPDPFDLVQSWLEELTGLMPSGEAAIGMIRELAELKIERVDIENALDWHKSHKGAVRYLTSLGGPIKTAHAQRIQNGGGRKTHESIPVEIDIPLVGNAEART